VVKFYPVASPLQGRINIPENAKYCFVGALVDGRLSSVIEVLPHCG